MSQLNSNNLIVVVCCLVCRCWFQDSTEGSQQSAYWSSSRWTCCAPRS